jgi:hypothetical protein
MKENLVNNTKWENLLNIILGAWVFIIPWVLGFGFERFEINVVMWNFSAIGLVVIVTSISSIRQLKPWSEWLSLYSGIWLICSPLFLVYWKYPILLWNSVIFGVLITGFSALAIPAANRKKIYHRIFRKNLILKNH